jgi:hypothetical protein
MSAWGLGLAFNRLPSTRWNSGAFVGSGFAMAKTNVSPVFILTPPDSLPPEPACAHKFYEAIGRFAVAWGGMETHLEALLQIAMNIEAKQPERPFQINLGRKIDALKDICRDCPKLKALESAVRNLSPTLKEWGQDRDFLIHSTLVGFIDGPKPKMVLRHIEHPKGVMIQSERAEFTLEIITGFTEQIRQLHRAIFPILEQAAALQDPQTVERAKLQAGGVDDPNAPIRL